MSAISGNKRASPRRGIADLLSNIPLQLAVLFVLLLCSIWTVIYLQLQSTYERINQNALRDGTHLSHAFAEQVKSSVRGIDLSLLSLREEWRSNPQQFHLAVLRQQDYFIQELVFQVGIIDADGYMVYSSLAPQSAPVSLADREHFRIHRDRKTDRLFISKPLLGRVSNRWSLQVTRPILGKDQEFLGVIVMSVPPDYFSRFYDTLNIGKDSIVSLIRSDGEILARAPNPEQGLGKLLSGRPFLAPDAPETGNIRVRSQTDSIERYHSWRLLKDYGLIVVIGESVQNLLTPYYLQRDAFVIGGGLGSALLVLFAGTVLVGLRQRAAATAALESSEERSSVRVAALEAVGNAVIITGTDARIQWVNAAFETLTGYTRDQAIGRRPSELVSSGRQDMAFYKAMWRDILSGKTWRGELVNRRADGTLYDEELVIAPVRSHAGQITHFVGVKQNISARKQAEQALRVAAAAFESQEGMMVTDAQGTILRVNRAFEEVTGYSADEVIGKTPAVLKSSRQDKEFYKKMWDAIGRQGHWEGEIWNRKKSGEIYPEWLVITAVKDTQEYVTHYVAAFSDITTRKHAEAQIRNLAFYDPLTSLPNRRLLADRAAHALAASARSGRYGALALLDLDHFKTLNDTLGHDVGDQLLIQVAQRLIATVRECDTVARLGGDEFVVMIQDLSDDRGAATAQAQAIGEKILAELNRPYQLKGGDAGGYRNTPSIGISQFLGHEQAFDILLKQADIALYQAKGLGRNTIRFYTDEMQTALNQKTLMEAGLREALTNGDFQLHFQPQVDSTQRIIGAEALLRWKPSGKQIVTPTSFIALAEETGLILPIGQWVLESACTQLAAWGARPDTKQLEISINVSARQFHQPRFVEIVRAALDASGADPKRLKLELTETMVLGDVEDTISKMRDLRELGVTFALDDFGTGYSSLSYLKRLPLDQVKIDQSFVRDIVTDSSDAAIVQTIISVSNSLGLKVIAEGVETANQLAFLQENDCRFFQGYLFGRPMLVEEFEEILAERSAAAV